MYKYNRFRVRHGADSIPILVLENSLNVSLTHMHLPLGIGLNIGSEAIEPLNESYFMLVF